VSKREWKDALEPYPGSKKKIGHKDQVDAKVEEWAEKPKVYTVRGKDVEFFSIGQLALALNRRPVTIRKWESEGIIPRSTFTAPSDDPRGKRRLYTRKQVEGIVKIAREEGILYDHSKHIKQTNFTARVIDLFKNNKAEAA
jgi:hypothetical protein